MSKKYKKSALKKMLSRPSQKQKKSSEYHLLIDNDGRVQTHKYPDNSKAIVAKKCSKSFTVGFIAGLCITQLFIFSFPNILTFYQNDENTSNGHSYDPYLLPNVAEIDIGTRFLKNEDNTIADKLYNEVRVLCWVMTNPDNHEIRAKHVKNTWGPRCNKLIFMSTTEDTELGTVALPVGEGREELWAKTQEAFKYIYKNHFDEYDWFMKADDDTYVIVENLRKMLYEYNTDYPIFLGSKVNVIVKQGYMNGGAGYVLSKEALKRFIEKGLTNSSICWLGHNGMEDVELAKCMENLEVLAGDSRDKYERGRMFVFEPAEQLLPERQGAYYWSTFYYKSDQGRLNCCSDHAISFHYVNPKKMNTFDYLIYRLRTFGITPRQELLPDKKSLDEIITALSIPSINNSSK